MKKLLSIALTGAVALSAGAYYTSSTPEFSTVAEEDVEYTEGTYEQLTYKKYTDHIEISGCDMEATEVVIPSEIDGLPVTIIGVEAFSEHSNLTKVDIPDSVTDIYGGAFEKCTSLESLDFPSSVEWISTRAAEGCTNLKQVIIRSVEVILYYAFSGCSNLESIYLPANLEYIYIDNGWQGVVGDGTAFNDCDNLKDVYYAGSEEEWGRVQEGYWIGVTPKNYKFDDSVTMHYNSPAPPREDTTEQTEALKGDANGDNAVTIADAVAILQYLANSDEYPLSEQGAKNADVAGGGDGINTDDALLIQQFDAGVAEIG